MKSDVYICNVYKGEIHFSPHAHKNKVKVVKFFKEICILCMLVQ